jgi:hypothetical protein
MIEEAHELERRKLDEDLRMWEECYKRFKDRFDLFGEYEKRIRELETELEKREKRWMIVERERNTLLVLAMVLTTATVFLLKTIQQIKNPWIFFIVGLLIGLGWAMLLQVIVRVPFFK